MKKKQNRKARKILLTGGHAATTALAVVEEITRRKAGLDIYWVGSEKAIEGKEIPTLESKVLPKLGVKVHSIAAGRLQRKFSFWTIPSLIKIPIGFIQAIFILKKLKPDIILSFGGYAAFPVVVAGRLLKIPILLHEQTIATGRANRFSAPFADRIAIARKESEIFFPKGKTIIVGNPIMKSVVNVFPKKELVNPPVIFITCGSRGSVSINDLIKKILANLLQDFIVIHQTGSLDFKRFRDLKSSFPNNLGKRYEVYPTIEPFQISSFYKRADIIIARSGANTVSEIMAVKRPSILIPLPIAYQDEQKKNALYAQKFGIAKVLDQKTLTSEELLKEIHRVEKNWYQIVVRTKGKVSPDRGAAAKLFDLVEEFV